MCDNNSSGQKKCSAKEGSSNRCKHGKLKSTGPSGANRRDSKRNSKEESNLNSKPCMSAPENNSSFSQSHDIQKIGSFRKDSGSGKGQRAFGSSELTLKTGNEIEVQVTDTEADSIQMQACDEQFAEQARPSTSYRKNSAQPDNFNQNQGDKPSECQSGCRCSQQGSMLNGDNSQVVNTEQPIEKFCPPSANEPPERESFGRRSSTEKKRCSFQLPGIVCDLPDEECEDTQENSSSMNNNDNDCSQEMSLLQQELMNANTQEEYEDDKWDYDVSGKRGTYKKIEYRKNPTTVTNLREKIQQYVRNRPDQIKPAPDKLTPFSDPIFTQCFEPVDEELERQLKCEKEAARKLMEQEKLKSEMQCYKKVIPFSLPCKTQLEYLDCLGASAAARVQYLQYAKLMQEADSYRKRMPTDWTCQQQMDYLDCMGVGEEVKRVLACTDEYTQPQAPAKNNGVCPSNGGSFAERGSFNKTSMQQNAFNSSFSGMANQQNKTSPSFSAQQNNPSSFSVQQNNPSSFSAQQNNPASFSAPSFSAQQNNPSSFSAPSFSAQQNNPASFSASSFSAQQNNPASFSAPSFSAQQNNPASFSAPSFSAQQNNPSSFSAQQNNPASFSVPSFSTPSFSAPTPFSADQNQEISEMIQQCKSEFRSSGLNVPRPPSSCKNADNARQSLTRRKSSPRGFDEDSSVYSANKNFTEEFASFDRKSSDVIGRERASSGERRSSGQGSCADAMSAKQSADFSDGRKSSFGNNYSTQFEQSVTKPMASFASAGSFVQEDDEDAPDTESDLNHPMFGKQTEAPEPTLLEEMQMYKTHLANIRRRYFGALCKEMENAEVITPDIAAAMVYSGELGISMKAAPEKVYDFLYPDAPGNQTINIANVMANLPKGLDDIVVPIVPPITLESRNYPDMEDPAMLDSPRVIQVGPALNLIDEPEAKGLIDPIDIKELVTGHTSANYLELMFPEVADMVVDDGEEEEEDEGENEEKAMEKARMEMFNIRLVETLPQHFSQVQMRGTIPPSWFPGYWSASPSVPGVYKSSNPSEVMEYIWEEMQPERVRPAGAAYIIGN